ncbi:hypothetical protein K9M50_03310 [Patescibacteria group bacterium]|nr:hypothetical protein [Patescibacteria group bacterium]
MCKKGIAAEVDGESGRINTIRVEKKQQKLVCTFIGRGLQDGRTVEVKKVKPANKKAAKSLDQALENLKIARSGLKVSPY